MAYAVTQNDIDLLFQAKKDQYIRLELLNLDFKIINDLENRLISYDLSISGDSLIRRTFNCTFIANSDWIISPEKTIWFNHYIRPYIGYKSVKTGIITWYKAGTFKMCNTGYTFNATTNQVTLSCNDLMCMLDGSMGGIIGGDGVGFTTLRFEAGADIRACLINLISCAGITKYDICQFNRQIPYDMEINVGGTYAKFIEEFITLYSGYEFFFNVDGVFTVALKPQLLSDPIILRNEIICNFVKEETKSHDLTKIANICEVWGQNIEADFVADACTGNSSKWVASVEALTEYKNGDIIAITVPASNNEVVTLNINSLGEKPVKDDDNKLLPQGRLQPDTLYCFRYRKKDDCFILLGQWQAYGMYEEKSKDCPYSTANLYEITRVITDDAIYSDSLCAQRAKYEVYMSTFMQDVLSLEMIDIPFLDVNQKISYIPHNETVENQYIVNSISRNSGTGMMNVSLTRFSEDYPDMSLIYDTLF